MHISICIVKQNLFHIIKLNMVFYFSMRGGRDQEKEDEIKGKGECCTENVKKKNTSSAAKYICSSTIYLTHSWSDGEMQEAIFPAFNKMTTNFSFVPMHTHKVQKSIECAKNWLGPHWLLPKHECSWHGLFIVEMSTKFKFYGIFFLLNSNISILHSVWKFHKL